MIQQINNFSLPDKEFLSQIDQHRGREIYARIIALNFNEEPIQEIEGMVTSGSINIDGASAVRRSCSLSLIADEGLIINDFYWGLKCKFKLEIGLRNTIDTTIYPEIIWFPQGVYVITGFNTSQNTNSYNISISGKDKMCLINGDMGGALPAQIDFGTEEIYDSVSNIITYTKIPIETIIRESVHTYAGEPYHNIIINDLNEASVELLEYRGDEPLYLLYNIESQIFNNYVDNGDIPCEYYQESDLENNKPGGWIRTIEIDGRSEPVTIGGFQKFGGIYDPRVTLNSTQDTPTKIRFLDEPMNEGQVERTIYTVAKIEYGQTAGYRYTDLTYPGELIGNVGESLTAVLDKIKSMLGEYEYFYDLNGQFIFQRKKIFIQNSWNNIKKIGDEQYLEPSAYSSAFIYKFEDGQLITSFSNSPTIQNLRNDFSVWGNRKSISGADLPIHYRYAIDRKPSYYKALDGQVYLTDETMLEKLKEDIKNSVINSVNDRVKNFAPQYMDQLPARFKAPVRNSSTYLYSPGWWDIRDWHDFYYAITQEEPCYTMKWYSKNNKEGCIPQRDIKPGAYENSYVWLVIYSPSFGDINTQHGSGEVGTNYRVCAKYKSIINKDTNELETFPVDINGNRVNFSQSEKKEFMAPYSGCSDSHTYLEFLEKDVKINGNRVYFYNPNFPGVSSDEDAIKDQIEKEIEELEKNYHLVDWREIIYQMAVDFYQNGTKDDFLSNISKNNTNYYPTGITGYEQYYLDLFGFWRQLYNPDMPPSYSPIGDVYSKYDDFNYPEDSIDNEELYTIGQWERVNNPDPVDANNLFAIKRIINQEGPNDANLININRWELQPWLEAIELLNWESENTENGGNGYYIQSQNNTFIDVVPSIRNQVRKNELFVKDGAKYVPLLESSQRFNFGSGSDKNLYKFNRGLGEKGIWSYNDTLLPLFYENNKYHKYLYQSKLDITGKPIQKSIPIKYKINYINLSYDFIEDGDNSYGEWNRFWTKQIVEDPASLNFWFDFLDADEPLAIRGKTQEEQSVLERRDYLGNYSTKVIGDRSKSVNDNKVTSIYFRRVPDLVFSSWKDYGKTNLKDQTGFTTVLMSGNLENMFTISAQGKSAQDVIDELVYNHSYCTESITVQAIPIYYLSPNTRIFVEDKKSGISGEYIVNKITIPLQYNGIMSITANKAPERLY